MPGIKPAFKIILAVQACAFIISCKSPGSNNQNASSVTQPQQAAPGGANVNKASPAPIPASPRVGGSIDVTSTPAGAVVVLIRDEEGSSGSPERKGATPVTITGVAPGKYSITLEKPGFKYFQKDVEVGANKTVKIAATLKRG